MTLQQLRYLIEVARLGSFNAAAQQLYVAQSTLSMAIRDLEQELDVQVFMRSNKGLTLTNDGIELLGYARQVVEQADLMEDRYAQHDDRVGRLTISTQHYAFCVRAFVSLVEEYHQPAYNLALRETRTSEIIQDVALFRSEIGILYLSTFNERVLMHSFEESSLSFTPLFEANAHVFLGSHHPLAHRKSLKLSDLDDYPRYSFEQGTVNSFHFAEEPFASIPHARNITYSDRGTLTNLLTYGNGYTLSTGVLSTEMLENIVAIPLEPAEVMRVGYIMHRERRASALVKRYIELLRECIGDSEMVSMPRASVTSREGRLVSEGNCGSCGGADAGEGEAEGE